MWEYVIESGLFLFLPPSGPAERFAKCYSGHGEGLNNPDFCAVRNIGPIPLGEYTIGGAYGSYTTGPLTMRLAPKPGTVTHGRYGFVIHGDSRARDFGASHGCIIMEHSEREKLSIMISKGINSLRVHTLPAS